MKKMSLLGVGPKLALLTLIYAIPVFVINALIPVFGIGFIPAKILIAIGIILLIVGIPFLLISGLTIKKVYEQDILYTKGAYSVCRHPLYAAWIFFIIPGILLFFKSWLLLTIPIVMCLIFKLIINGEENYLKERYGADYETYKSKISQLLPLFWRYSK